MNIIAMVTSYSAGTGACGVRSRLTDEGNFRELLIGY